MKTETNEVNDIEMNEANAMSDVDTDVARVEAAIAAEAVAHKRRAQRVESVPAKPRRKRERKPATVQVTFRVPAAWVERADNIGRRLSRAGLQITRTDALRASLAVGLDAIEKEKRR
jgi:hypothetical protein